MDEDTIAPLLAAVALGTLHLTAGKLTFLGGIPRSRWLSLAGGISVAYVIVHLLPELSRAQEAVADESGEILPFLEDHVYLLALTGLALFYVVEHSARRSRDRHRRAGGEDQTTSSAFWLSMTSFAAYNAVIGYLLVHREESTLESLVLFAVALGVHFVVNDFGLRRHHKDAYQRVGRWLLAGSVLVGWVIGELMEISEAAIGLLLAFIAGGVILNVFKEELPEERQSRLWAFALGAGGYAALLQAI